MAGNEKRFNDAAFKWATTWDTEVDANEALAGLRPLNPGAPKLNYPAIELDEVSDPNETGIGHANYGPCDFTLDFRLDYNDGAHKLIAGVFGADAVEPLFVVVAGTNNFIDFEDTAAATKAAEVAAGSYTGTTLATAIAAAMNGTTPTGTFTCTWSASTLKFTIAESSGPSNFKLLWNTGTNKAKDISTLCGYSDAADDTGAATYASDTACTGSGAYQHTLTMDDETDGVFGTYAVEKGTKIHLVPSCKPIKFSLSVDNGMIKASVGMRGTKVIDNSSVMTSVASVTYPTATSDANRVKYYQGVFWINSQSGDALDSGDAVKPKAFTLELDRPMDSEHGASSATIQEPKGNGKPKVKLNQEFSRLETANESFFADWTAGNEYKESIVFTGATIVGTHTYKITFYLPKLQIEDDEIADANVLAPKVSMRSVVASSAPTGMTVTKPLTCIIVNTRSTSLLV